MSWKDLDIRQKAELIKLGVQSGIRDIKQIRQLYDDNNIPTQAIDQSYNETNVMPMQGIERIKQEYGIPEEEINKTNEILQQIQNEISLEEINNQQPIQFRQFKNGGKIDNPPFMQRILNNDNRSVNDWEYPSRKATHKLSYAQTDEGYIVYPEVQIVDGQIHDFTDPKYNHGKWDALDNAIRNGDTLRFSTEEQALRYTQEYKNKYPEYFKQFNKGGFISNNPTQALVGKVNKFREGGYEGEDDSKNINNSILGRYVQSRTSQNNQKSQKQPIIITEKPVSGSTYVQQPPLNIQEQELLNYLQSNPTAEQDYFRNLAIQNMTATQSNQGVIQTKEKQDLIGKTFQGYNNFRYSHPWAEGLNYMPIIGDGMDLISLAGAVNNKDYMTAGLELGMLALPNFIQKPLQKYGKLQNIPDEVWDDLYNKAIKNNNLEEVQQLRDLHFKAKAPNTKTDIPLWTSSEEDFNQFDLSHFGETDSGSFGYGHYLTPLEKYASTYHPINRKFYVNMENPYIGDNAEFFNREQFVIDRLARRKENIMHNLHNGKLTNLSKKLGIDENTSLKDAEHLIDKYIADETVKWNNRYAKYANEFEGKDGVLSWREVQGIPNKREGMYVEVVVPKGEQIKSADAVTYDDNGKIIPLSKRDNFNNPDLRYSWLIPTIPFGLMSYKLFNQNNKEEYKKGGFLFPNQAFSHKFEK